MFVFSSSRPLVGYVCLLFLLVTLVGFVCFSLPLRTKRDHTQFADNVAQISLREPGTTLSADRLSRYCRIYGRASNALNRLALNCMLIWAFNDRKAYWTFPNVEHHVEE